METVKDPVVQDMLKKVEIVADPELNKLYPEKFPTNIEITMRNGQVYKGEMYYAKGSSKNSFTDEEIRQKFASLALPVLDKKRVDRILEMAEGLEDLKDIREFSRLFA